MSKSEYVEFEGHVSKLLPGGKFLVSLENGTDILAHLSGKMRMNKINVLVEDRVTVEISPYDLTQGRISFRHK
jgi:translation initiation factor IF-1